MNERRDLDERLLEYAARIIRLVESLPQTIAGKRIGDQLLRSGTSPGANQLRAILSKSVATAKGTAKPISHF
jgi:four helix bundle protein